MTTANKLSTTRKLWSVLTDSEVVGINFGLAALAAVCGLVLYVGSGVAAWVALGLLGIVASLAGVLLYHGVKTFDNYESQLLRHKAAQWAREADTDSERTRRMSDIESMGPTGAMLASGLAIDDWATPAFNIDGTPMLPGGVDLHGHVFGQTDDATLSFDNDPLGTDAFGGYEAPIGMDASTGSDPHNHSF